MKIGILTAMAKEHDQIVALLADVHHVDGQFPYVEGRINTTDIVLQQCGIGKVNAAIGASEMIRQHTPDCIISTGVAGGIDPCLHVMDVVASSHCVHHDFNLNLGYERGEIQGLTRFFPSDQRLVDTVRSLAEPTIHVGLICTGDQFITSHDELATIKQYFPEGLAVDMESAAIAQTCYIYHVPFISFRIISDTPGADNHQQQYENFWGEMAQRSFGITRRLLLQLSTL
ncbi:MAG: 5'-methylthioadenosine/adenosylhomocysteine nucleosidase [Prevotellaceae bacterium]|nr:5'-methylthioadenosine/adenosylhomocysteine nucleosidase [Prevotellaceae bacterium]